MRYFSIFFLILVLAAIGLFAWHNHEPVSVRFFHWAFEVPLAALAGGIYVLGMLSGWSLLRALRRSIIHATERREL
jgi:uncharacterized integral membrane protein